MELDLVQHQKRASLLYTNPDVYTWMQFTGNYLILVHENSNYFFCSVNLEKPKSSTLRLSMYVVMPISDSPQQRSICIHAPKRNIFHFIWLALLLVARIKIPATVGTY